MPQVSQAAASRAMPVQFGQIKLVIPQGPCHPVVGLTYQQQETKQVGIIKKILVGERGSMPQLSRDEFPEPAFWEKLRSEGQAAESQTSSANTQFDNSDSAVVGNVKCPKGSGLVHLMRCFPVGELIIQYLWANDVPSIGRLASTSKGMLNGVAIYLSRFNMVTGDYQDCDRFARDTGNMNPQRRDTIGIGCYLFVRGKDLYAEGDPRYGLKSFPNLWAVERTRQHLFNCTQVVKGNGPLYFNLLPLSAKEEQLTELEKRLQVKRDAYGVTDDPLRRHHLREISYPVQMLRAFSQFGQNLKLLRLHEVPMLDVRVVSLVLSVTPNLKSLSIFKCDLLHFNTVTALLDLIHWNSKQMMKAPVILDFYPMTYYGSFVDRQGTHVISWDGLDLGQLGPDALTTVLLAVFKALPMGTNLLSDNNAFRRFIDLLPMKIGASTIFLHHFLMYLDSINDGNLSAPARKELENQVLLAVYQGTGNHFKYCERSTYFESYECCRCGLTMIRGLFRKDQHTRSQDQRVCRVCQLDYELEGQQHHNLPCKRQLIKLLLHNDDEAEAKNLIRLDDRPSLRQDLANIKAPIMPNVFISGPAAGSRHRRTALKEHLMLPEVTNLVHENRSYDIFRAAGAAAMLDVQNASKALDGIHPDDAFLSRQPVLSKKSVRQTWEHEMHKYMTADQQGGFW